MLGKKNQFQEPCGNYTVQEYKKPQKLPNTKCVFFSRA